MSLFSPISGDSANSALTSFAGVFGSGSAGIFAGSSGPIPSNLLVTLNTGLIGQPTLGGQTVTAVGPMIDTGSAALAEAGTGLGQAIQFTGAANVSPSAENADLIADSESAGPKPDANDPGVVAASLAMLAQKDPVAKTLARMSKCSARQSG